MKLNEKNPDGIMVVGDIHAMFYDLWALIAKKNPSIIIAAGDFGYWPGYPPWEKFIAEVNAGRLLKEHVIVYWIDGNHENHHAIIENILKPAGKVVGSHMVPIEMAPNLFYCPRGSILEIPDGRKILFAGGAYSIDKHMRKLGVDWFPEETLSHWHVGECFPRDVNIDIIVSHTCPLEFMDTMLPYDPYKANDETQNALSMCLEMYKPDLWYLAHWHHWARGSVKNTKWEALNMNCRVGWYNWLPEGGHDAK